MNNFNKLSLCLITLLCSAHAFGMDKAGQGEQMPKKIYTQAERDEAAKTLMEYYQWMHNGGPDVLKRREAELKQQQAENDKMRCDLDVLIPLAHNILRELRKTNTAEFYQALSMWPHTIGIPDDLTLDDADES